jgi:hypothetical protein
MSSPSSYKRPRQHLIQTQSPLQREHQSPLHREHQSPLHREYHQPLHREHHQLLHREYQLSNKKLIPLSQNKNRGTAPQMPHPKRPKDHARSTSPDQRDLRGNVSQVR